LAVRFRGADHGWSSGKAHFFGMSFSLAPHVSVMPVGHDSTDRQPAVAVSAFPVDDAANPLEQRL